MKSWISFLLPSDEYKEKRILYFLSEGSFILLISLIILLMINRYVPNFHNYIELALMLSIVAFLIYVTARYTISGMEYADIATERSYKKELKNIFRRTGSFVVIFMLLYLLFAGMPSSLNGWVEIIGLILITALLWFFTSFISLKRSYKKNKELL